MGIKIKSIKNRQKESPDKIGFSLLNTVSYGRVPHWFNGQWNFEYVIYVNFFSITYALYKGSKKPLIKNLYLILLIAPIFWFLRALSAIVINLIKWPTQGIYIGLTRGSIDWDDEYKISMAFIVLISIIITLTVKCLL